VNQVHVSPSGCPTLLPAVLAEHCFSTIQDAVDFFPDNADIGDVTIWVHAGTYRNSNWRDDANRSAFMFNRAVVSIKNKQHMAIRAANSNARPLVQFDGSGGFVITDSHHLLIEGLEIEGPARRITGAEASENRARMTGKNSVGEVQPCSKMGCQSCTSEECASGCEWQNDMCLPESYSYFQGNGITVWHGSTHLTFRNNVVHHCPGSGIRVNKGDEVTIDSNVVYDNTWWTFSAPSAIVLAESLGTGSNTISHNLVFGNRNFIPFFSPDLSSIAHSGTGVPNYAEAEQDYIIDGSGVYLTRNYDYRGTFYLTNNVAYDNGINGLVVHKTNHAVVQSNWLFSNGRVTKDIEGRQDAGGLVINNSENVTLSRNTVAIHEAGDISFQCFGTCGFTDGAGNVACPLGAGVNSKFTAVTLSDTSCFQTRSLDFLSSAPVDPQYTWLYYPCSGKLDGDACDPCKPGDMSCAEPAQPMACKGVHCVDPCADVLCVAKDSCHAAGSCTNGVCDDPPKEDGSPCDDGDILTSSDQCSAGVCKGVPPCVHCSDERNSYMAANDLECGSWTWGMSNRCASDLTWATGSLSGGKTCQLSCYLAGNGYGGDSCCTAQLQAPELEPSTSTHALAQAHVRWAKRSQNFLGVALIQDGATVQRLPEVWKSSGEL